MKITELIAELEKQLGERGLSDEETQQLRDLRRQLSAAFDAFDAAGQRAEGDDDPEDKSDDGDGDDGDRKGDHDDGQRAADDDVPSDPDAGQRSDAADVPPDPDAGQRAVNDDAPAPGDFTLYFQAARAVLDSDTPSRRSLPDANDDGNRSLNHVPNIHPNSRVPRHDDLKGLDLGMYFRALNDPNKFRVAAKRELAWMDRNLGHGFQRTIDDGAYIPFVMLAEHGPKAKERAAQRALDGVTPEQHLERFMPLAEHAYRAIMDQEEGYGRRTMTTAATSAGAGTGVIVDIARSLMWLTEQDSALEMMTVVPGLRGEWQGFYGNAKPTVDWVDEAADITETNPTLVRLRRSPSTMGMYWSISNRQLQTQDYPIGAMIERGCEDVFRTQGMRGFLSGNDVGASFANDAQAFDGLMNSGITETSFGAAITNLNRDDMVDARRRLFGDEVDMSGLGWILSNAVATQLEKTRIGGVESVRFVYEDGMIDSGAERIAARDTVHLGKTGTTAPAVLLQRAAAVCLIWGAGILFNALRLPGRTKTEYDLQIEASFAMMNPKRATVLKQG